ncbi:MAG: DUF1858 domain-containing protein [Minisyncoccales bacterium]|jgi:hybrid cluster-associated redox disulfide protein
MKMKIVKEMKIGDLLRNHPEVVDVFLKYGLSCVGCPMSDPESVEEAALVHNINLKDLLKELNDAVEDEN